VISGSYTKISIKNRKMRFSCHLVSDEITTRGYKTVTFAKCTPIMIAELAVTRGLGSSLDWMVWVWNDLVLIFV
jgi:hypothetical protein